MVVPKHFQAGLPNTHVISRARLIGLFELSLGTAKVGLLGWLGMPTAAMLLKNETPCVWSLPLPSVLTAATATCKQRTERGAPAEPEEYGGEEPQQTTAPAAKSSVCRPKTRCVPCTGLPPGLHPGQSQTGPQCCRSR